MSSRHPASDTIPDHRPGLQAAAAGCWRLEGGVLRLDDAARSLFGLDSAALPLDDWLGGLDGDDARALADAFGKTAAPLAAVLQLGPRQLLMRGSASAGAWQGIAVELPPAAHEHDEFFAAISHELRTPLNAILGFARLAHTELPPEVDRRHIGHIEQASQLMLRVVDDLLDLTRLEAGKLDIDPDQPLDLPALAARIGVLAAGLRRDKAIRLYTVVDADCPAQLRGDAVRIEQVLANLIGNALEFTERGRVVLGVKLRERRADKATLRLSVSATGIGIEFDRLPRIGTPFERRSRASGGAGLGLAVVRRLLELHGTQLQVASVEGGGTICWFDLTLALDAAAVVPTPVADSVVFSTDRRLAETVATQWRMHGHALLRTATASRARRWIVDAELPEAAERVAQARRGGHDCIVVSALPAANALTVDLPMLATATFRTARAEALAADPRIQGLRVLAVEDNALDRQVLAGFLGHLGAEVELVAGGAEALARLNDEPFDIALLDIQLAGESGLELAQAIRSLPAGAALPIVFLSAQLDETDRITATTLDALACLAKPFDADALRALLARVPHHAPRSAAPAAAAPTTPLRALFAGLWPGQREAIEKATDHQSLRRAVRALRGSLAVLGERAALTLARTVEEGLLEGHPAAALPLAALIASAETIARG